MTYHSDIKLFDVFVAEQNGQYNKSKRHYFVCIYNQEKDPNNRLDSDLYGIMITSNKKYETLFEQSYNDYNVEIRLDGKISYALCDKIQRIPNNLLVQKKNFTLTKGEIYNIKKYFNKFINEVKRQTNIKE